MSTSNSKFRTGSKEAPTEPFKRAVTSCLRAIARAPELEVSFAAERPGLAWRKTGPLGGKRHFKIRLSRDCAQAGGDRALERLGRRFFRSAEFRIGCAHGDFAKPVWVKRPG